MKKLKFIFERTLTFETAVWRHYYSLRCVPPDTPLQKIQDLDFQISPGGMVTKAIDCFQNHLYTGFIEEPHDYFHFCTEGTAYIKKGALKDERFVSLYKYPTDLTQVQCQLGQYYESLSIESCKSPLEKAVYLLKNLQDKMVYQAQYTSVDTTATEAFSIGKGVCQDYAHILIALCRKAQIPSRYIVGFIIGEGETHAWVEVYSNGFWYGLDPTHQKEVDENYIKLAVGRDYMDCNIDKGIFCGNTIQRQKILVKVEELYG